MKTKILLCLWTYLRQSKIDDFKYWKIWKQIIIFIKQFNSFYLKFPLIVHISFCFEIYILQQLDFISVCMYVWIQKVTVDPLFWGDWRQFLQICRAITLHPDVLLSKFMVCFDIYLEERPFHTLKTNINSVFSNVSSFHSSGISLMRAMQFKYRIIVISSKRFSYFFLYF
jgi:hypothetical protein